MQSISEVKSYFLNSFPKQRIFFTQSGKDALQNSLSQSNPEGFSEYYLSMLEDSLIYGHIESYEVDDKGRFCLSLSDQTRYYMDKSVLSKLFSFWGICGFLSKELLGITENVCNLPKQIVDYLLGMTANLLHYFVCHVVSDRIVGISLPDRKYFDFNTVLTPGEYRLSSAFDEKLIELESSEENFQVLKFTDEILRSASVYLVTSSECPKFKLIWKIAGMVSEINVGIRIGLYDEESELCYVSTGRLSDDVGTFRNQLSRLYTESKSFRSIFHAIISDDRFERVVQKLGISEAMGESLDIDSEQTYVSFVLKFKSLLNIDTAKGTEKRMFESLMGEILYRSLASCRKCGGSGCSC